MPSQARGESEGEIFNMLATVRIQFLPIHLFKAPTIKSESLFYVFIDNRHRES